MGVLSAPDDKQNLWASSLQVDLTMFGCFMNNLCLFRVALKSEAFSSALCSPLSSLGHKKGWSKVFKIRFSFANEMKDQQEVSVLQANLTQFEY